MDYLVIPAYEPDFNLIRLLKKIKEKSQMELIVVNDGSSSKAKVLFEQAEQYAATIGAAEQAHDLGSAGTDQPGESEDLAFFQLKAHIVDAGGP